MEHVPARKLKELLKIARKAHDEKGEISDSLRKAERDVVEQHHMHRKAWAQVKREDRMEPEEYAEFRDHLDHMRGCLGLNEKAASAPRMDLDEPEVSTENEVIPIRA